MVAVAVGADAVVAVRALFLCSFAVVCTTFSPLGSSDRSDSRARSHEVRVQWRNTGRLPTALKQAQLVKIVQEDRLYLTFPRDTAAQAARAPRILEPDQRGGAVDQFPGRWRLGDAVVDAGPRSTTPLRGDLT